MTVTTGCTISWITSARVGETNFPVHGHKIVIEAVLKDATLREIDGTWALFYQGREYMRLLDAKSRKDAEQQISEMLFLRADSQLVAQRAENTAREDI